MEQQIRFCTSADGTRIAHATYGSGPGTPLVMIHNWGLPQEAILARPAMWQFYEQLAEGRRVVGYDRRGTGASDRDIDDVTLEAEVADLAAVADSAGLTTFDVCAFTSAIAVAYARSQPGRVARMILWTPSLRGYGKNFADLADVMETNWSMARRALASLIFPTGPADLQRWLSQTMRDSISPALAAKFLRLEANLDLGPLLEDLRVPTLVVELRGQPTNSRAVAARLPDSRFVVIDGDNGTPYSEPLERARLVVAFLDEGRAQPEASPAPSGDVVTILFTDIVGHTEMMQRLGDAKGRAVLREHERITREALQQHGGSEVKTDGDSFMASFASVSAAVECAVALQRAFAAYSATGDEPIVIRIGLNVGEPIEEDGDYFGSAVILGARIKDQAAGGEILVPEAVRHLLAGKDFLFSDRGEVALRGFEDPVRLHEVRWRSG
jgi:class 3 adenylate cyclase